MSSAVLQREKRKTAGRRMTSLVGKAQEADDAFWGHDTWAEEGSDNDSFHDSDEDSALKKDEFDSDFDDSESDHDEEEKAAGMEEEREINRQERSNQQRKSKYVDSVKGGKKKGSGRRIMGDGMNAGIVLNFPPPASASSSLKPITPIVVNTPQVAKTPQAEQVQPKKTSVGKRPRRSESPTLATHRERRSQQRKLRETRSTPAETNVAKKGPKPGLTKKSKRRLYTQEELLLESVHDTEPENQRWLLARKRVQDQTDKDRDLSIRDKSKGKVIQKYNSRRGCLITLTFPEMDAVPEILTRQKIEPRKSEKSFCVITGKPARYRDPKTQLPYFDIAAFKELRRRQEAGEPLDKRPKQKKKISVSPAAPLKASQKQIDENGTGPIQQKSVSVIPSVKKTISSGQKLPSTSIAVRKNPPSDVNGSDIGDVKSDIVAALVPKVASAPLSPSGTRQSSRQWKPSEKLLQNIVNGRSGGTALAPGLHLKGQVTIGEQPPEVLSGTIATASTAVDPPLKHSKNGDVSPNGVPSGLENAPGAQSVQNSNGGTSNTSKGSTSNEKKTSNASQKKNATTKKRKAPVKTSSGVKGKKKPNTNSPSNNDAKAQVSPKKKNGGKQVAKKNVLKQPPASKQACTGGVENVKPDPEANLKFLEIKPSASAGSDGTPTGEQVYTWTPEGKGKQEPQFVTQSDLIMQVIANYSKQQEERQGNANNK